MLHRKKDCISDLPSCSLTHEASGLSFSGAILSKAEALDMCVREGTVVAGVALDLADLNHAGVKWA
jgi:hypothetical protein